MQERRIWPLAALAALTAVSVARRPGGADGRPERRSASALLREPREEEAIAPPRPAARAWAFFRPSWRAVPWRVYQKMNDNRLLAVAAGVVFYGLLALFPALTAFVSLYGLVADPSSIHARLSLVSGILPQGALDIVNEQLTRLTAHRASALSFGFIGGLLFALWSANAGSKAIMDGLNVAYGETEKRSFLRLNLVALAFTLGALLAMMLALGAVVVVRVFLSHFGLAGALDALIRTLRWPLLLACRARFDCALSLRSEPQGSPVDVAVPRECHRGHRLACGFGAFFLVHRQLRDLRCDLRVIGRGHRHDDVDVDFGDRGASRGRTERRDRTRNETSPRPLGRVLRRLRIARFGVLFPQRNRRPQS